MMEFFSMGGYGSYVWSAFGLSALVLLWNWFSATRQFRNSVKIAKARQAAAGMKPA